MTTAPITTTTKAKSVKTITYRIGDRIVATLEQSYPGEDSYFLVLHGKAMMDGVYPLADAEALIRDLGPCTPVGLSKRDWSDEDAMRAACTAPA